MRKFLWESLWLDRRAWLKGWKPSSLFHTPWVSASDSKIHAGVYVIGRLALAGQERTLHPPIRNVWWWFSKLLHCLSKSDKTAALKWDSNISRDPHLAMAPPITLRSCCRGDWWTEDCTAGTEGRGLAREAARGRETNLAGGCSCQSTSLQGRRASFEVISCCINKVSTPQTVTVNKAMFCWVRTREAGEPVIPMTSREHCWPIFLCSDASIYRIKVQEVFPLLFPKWV